MKKILLILAMVGMVAVGCTEGGVDDNIDNGGNNTEQPGNGGGNEDEIPTDKIVIEPTTIEVAAEASDYVVAVSSPCSWRATTENEWITIETKLGIDGKRELIFSVADSYELEPREGKILVSNSDEGLSAELVVTQKALVPEWSIDVETLHFEANGGEQTIEIVANFVEYQATSEVDWITFEYQENGVVVKVATSNIDEERSAEITISTEKYDLSKTITIVQYAQDANRLIYYTSSDNAVVILHYAYFTFNESIVSNTYNDNRGVIFFDAPVTSIGGNAFANCTSLTSITIPDSVTSIGDYAFGGCTSLTSVTIGNGVTSIGNGAFKGCTSLTSITIPDSVTSIGEQAFYNCSSLTSITIPDSVTSIGNEAFYDCTSLTSVTIGNGVTEIQHNEFADCTSLTSVTIGNGVTEIGGYAFSGCTSLTSITIPDSVTKIHGDAFSGCTSLTSITIPDSVTEIEWLPWYEFPSLTDVYVNITDLATYATSNPMRKILATKHLLVNGIEITNLTIPDSVTEIGDSAFRDCTSLTSITIPDSVTEIGDSAFSGCTSLISVTIGNGVTEIGGWAFVDCTSLTSITIPDSVTSIGESAFRDCTSLTSVTIGNGVTEIGNSAFRDCTSLTSITIPDSVTSIGEYAFRNCTSLTSVTIGNGVTSIGEYAFRDCPSLTEVYCKPTTPPAIYVYYDSYYFYYGSFPFNSGMKIYVPRSSYEAYMQYSSYSDAKIAQTNWYKYESYIEPYDFE